MSNERAWGGGIEPYVNTTIGTHTGPWTFEQALTCLKAGGKVRRKAWLRPDHWIRLDATSFFDDRVRRCHIDTDDILANDWEPVS